MWVWRVGCACEWATEYRVGLVGCSVGVPVDVRLGVEGGLVRGHGWWCVAGDMFASGCASKSIWRKLVKNNLHKVYGGFRCTTKDGCSTRRGDQINHDERHRDGS